MACALKAWGGVAPASRHRRLPPTTTAPRLPAGRLLSCGLEGQGGARLPLTGGRKMRGGMRPLPALKGRGQSAAAILACLPAGAS